MPKEELQVPPHEYASSSTSLSLSHGNTYQPQQSPVQQSTSEAAVNPWSIDQTQPVPIEQMAIVQATQQVQQPPTIQQLQEQQQIQEQKAV